MDFTQRGLQAKMQARLAQRQQQNLYRQRKTLYSPQQARVEFEGTWLLNFSSNDYLGLANHPKLLEASQTACRRYGFGSGASHLVCGHSAEHQQLEEELASFTGRDRALLFSTGYMANIGIIQALLDRGDGVFEDKLNHASLLDGGLISGAKFQRFLHSDCEQLGQQLKKSEAQQKLVVVDGVYSMDGDLAPLPQLFAQCQQNDATLMVDDAHGFGVLGETGAGVAEHFQLGQQQLPVLMATLGKALGCFGAFVAGSDTLIDYLIQFARPYIYTTALPPSVAAAARQALRLVQEEPERRQQLHDVIAYFRQQSQQLGFAEQGIALMPSSTAIQPLLIGCAEKCMALASHLQSKGFLVGAIRPPTVPANSARLRITLNAEHRREHIDGLLQAIREFLATQQWQGA